MKVFNSSRFTMGVFSVEFVNRNWFNTIKFRSKHRKYQERFGHSVQLDILLLVLIKDHLLFFIRFCYLVTNNILSCQLISKIS